VLFAGSRVNIWGVLAPLDDKFALSGSVFALLKIQVALEQIGRYWLPCAHLWPGYLAAAVNKLDGDFAGTLPEPKEAYQSE
jgi:hypothetical protein